MANSIENLTNKSAIYNHIIEGNCLAPAWIPGNGPINGLYPATRLGKF